MTDKRKTELSAQHFTELLAIARRKAIFDQSNPWYQGPETYLEAMKREIDEVVEEVPKHRACFLEDELGDLLWNYLNILLALEKQTDIDPDAVLARACKKYEDRISGIENGQLWKDIKAQQKAELRTEQQARDNKAN